MNSMQSHTILKLNLLFDTADYFAHRQSAFKRSDPAPLSAVVTRLWHDNDGQVSPATGKVYNNLEFRIEDAIPEDASGARFLVSAVATAELQMEHGVIADNTTGSGSSPYVEGTEGIQKDTALQLFIDLQSHAGVIRSYEISEGFVIKLSTPDDIHFDPDPDPARTIPYNLRRPFREDLICQHRPPAPNAPEDPAKED